MQVYLDRLMIKYKDVTEKQFSDVLTKISSKQIFLRIHLLGQNMGRLLEIIIELYILDMVKVQFI